MAKQQAAGANEAVEPVKSTRIYLGVFIAAALVFAGATWLATGGMLAGWEHTLLSYVNGWPDGLRSAFLVATIAPESLWFGIVAVIVTFLLKMYRLAWRLSLSILLGSGLVAIAKQLVDRARPLELADGFTVRVQELGLGYPSMHAMMVTVIFVTLLPYLPRGWRWVIVVVPIVAMAVSRMYLGVHAPLDVVGGVAAGLLIVAGLRSLPARLQTWLRVS